MRGWEPGEGGEGGVPARPTWPALSRALREAAGVTQEGWAAQLGIGRRTVQRWERGEATPDAVTEESLLALCGRRALFHAYAGGPLAGTTVTPELLRAVIATARL